MPQLPLVASDSWTLPQRAAIIDQYNQSGASTEPQETKPSKWTNMWAKRPALDEEGGQEPIRALIDCELGVRLFGAANLFKELAAKQADARSNSQQMRLRLSYLKLEAKAEREPFNPASEQDFWQSMNSLPFVKKPRIFLVENGDLRAVWKGEEGAHIGLQFLGDGKVQFVIFAKRPDARSISRVYGRDTFKGILRQIADFEVDDLIYG